MQIVDLQVVPLPYTRIVCTAAKCTEALSYQGQTKMDYKSHCVPQYYQHGISLNSVGDPGILAALGGLATCSKCGCFWQLHMAMNYENQRVKRSVSVSQADISVLDAEIRQIQDSIRPMQSLVREYEQEYRTILDVASKYAKILVDNSNMVRFFRGVLDFRYSGWAL